MDAPWLKLLQNPTHSTISWQANYKLQITNFPHYSFSEQMCLPRAIRAAGIDLFFSPHFNVPLFCPVPFVLTVHDLILHRYPNRAKLLRQFAYRFLMRNALNRSRTIIAVSNFTAQEVIHVYGPKLQNKIVTIHEGVSEHFAPRPQGEQELLRIKYNLNRPFFLYVGNAKEHKNVPMLLEAFRRLGQEGVELVLVTGGKEAKRLRLPDHVKIIPSITENDLPALYTAALAFVTPTLYEGFGLPILEALACGCPVIAVRSQTLLEIAGAHVQFVSPDPQELAASLRSPPPHYDSIRQFSWADTAAKTATILLSS